MEHTVPHTMYDLAGGDKTIRALVTSFYDRVYQDAVLRPLFPDNVSEIREKQYQFLTQFFGGPALYTQTHGAPMLRARHLKVAVGPKHAAAWLHCMSEALTDVGISGSLRDAMLERLGKAAHHMVNHAEDGTPLQGPPVIYLNPREPQ